MTRYVLTGTTGRLGSRVLHKILEKKLIDPGNLIISSSNPSRVPSVARQHSIEVRRGDYADIDSLKTSFAGADVLFLVSHPDPGVQRVQFHIDAIETARAAGIKTVIYSSMMFGGETGLQSIIGIQQGHIHTMKYLAQSGIDHIIIREGLYAQVWDYYAGFQGGPYKKADTEPLEWVVPNENSIAWVDIDDLSEGNAIILANYKEYLGKTLSLTGPRATSVTEIAKLVEEKTGRRVSLRFVGREEAVRYHKERQSVPPQNFKWLEENWGGWFKGLANGEGEGVDPLLGKLLGRPVNGINELAGEMFTPR